MDIRVRSKTGVTKVTIQPTATFAQLKSTIGAASIRSGFPPRPVTADDSAPVSDFLSNGDVVIVQETATTASTKTKQTSTNISTSTSAPPSSSVLSMGKLVVRVVPDDNSCLFRSINGILSQPDNAVTPLRSAVAEAVRSQPNLYSEAYLGKSNSEYCQWIGSENAWGGAIELSILSNRYKMELAAFDVKTMRLDRYGEGNGYRFVGYLIYDGIHYNYMAIQLSASPDKSTDVTMFAIDDMYVLEAAKTLAQQQHDNRNYTDTDNFTLKCGQCGTKLKGDQQAMQHAQATGHSQFEEA